MKLRFADPDLTRKCANLVRSHGFTPSVYEDGNGWQVVETAIDGKQRRAFMADWMKLTLIDNDQKAQQLQRKLPL